MNKALLTVIGIVVILVIGFFILNNYIYTEKQGETIGQPGYLDTTYTIEGQPVALVDGRAETSAATGTAMIVTTSIGYEAEGDLNEDGVSDIAFLVTQDMGGSGTFYYVVAGLKTDDGYAGTVANSLGDRVAPQSTEVVNGVITVNYALPEAGAPMTAEPTRNVSKRLVVVNGELVAAE